MDTVLSFLVTLFGVCLALNLLSLLTRYARKRSRRANPENDQPSLESLSTDEEAKAAAPIAPFPFSMEPVQKEQTAAWWWSQLLSGKAVLGVLFLPLQLAILVINSYVLALRLEVLLGHAGESLFTFTAMGWSREITIFDVVGLLISVMEMITAAAFIHSRAGSSKSRGTSLVSLIALLCTICVEVALSVLGGLAEDTPMWTPILNGLLALSLALTGSVCGVFIIEHLIVPLLLSVAWTSASPFRAATKLIRLKASRYRMEAISRPAKPQIKNRPSRAWSLLCSIDPIFQPTRDFDALISRKLRFRKLRG